MSLNEQLLIRYLLGQMSEDERDHLDEQFFGDKDFVQQLQLVEDELIESYIGKELSPTDHKRFEDFFLRSDDRRRRVAFARHLHLAISRSSVSTKQTAHPLRFSWRDWFHLPSRWAIIPLTASLLLAALSLWLMWQINRANHELEAMRVTLSAQQKNAEELEQQLSAERHRSGELAEQIAQQSDSNPTTNQKTQPPKLSSMVAFVLHLGISRSEGNSRKLVIAPDAKQARLYLKFKTGDYKNYRITLETAEGRQVLNRASLKAQRQSDGKTVVVTLPAEALGEADYILTLNGITSTGDAEPVGEYFFQVLRR